MCELAKSLFHYTLSRFKFVFIRCSEIRLPDLIAILSKGIRSEPIVILLSFQRESTLDSVSAPHTLKSLEL